MVNRGEVTFPAPQVSPPEVAAPPKAAEATAVAVVPPPTPFSLKLREAGLYGTAGESISKARVQLSELSTL